MISFRGHDLVLANDGTRVCSRNCGYKLIPIGNDYWEPRFGDKTIVTVEEADNCPLFGKKTNETNT